MVGCPRKAYPCNGKEPLAAGCAVVHLTLATGLCTLRSVWHPSEPDLLVASFRGGHFGIGRKGGQFSECPRLDNSRFRIAAVVAVDADDVVLGEESEAQPRVIAGEVASDSILERAEIVALRRLGSLPVGTTKRNLQRLTRAFVRNRFPNTP